MTAGPFNTQPFSPMQSSGLGIVLAERLQRPGPSIARRKLFASDSLSFFFKVSSATSGYATPVTPHQVTQYCVVLCSYL